MKSLSLSLLHRWQCRFWLFLACAVPSLGTALKFGHARGLAAYLLAAAIWTGFGLPMLGRRLWAASPAVQARAERNAPRLAVVVMALLAALFLVAYPLSRSGRLGKGTDRADALNISIPRYLHGENPYTVRTYLGNPVTPLPGALALGAPFRVVFRDAAYQNLLWIGVLFLLLCTVAPTRTEAFLLWATLIFLCPALLQDVMTGGDFTSNAIYCAAATLWLLQALAASSAASASGGFRFWRLPLLAAFWGVCLCSRPSYLVLAPFVLAYAIQKRGWPALGIVGLALGVYAALVLPIYLPAPQDFSPLHIASKITVAGRMTGTGQAATLLGGGAVGLAALLGLAAWLGRRQEKWFPLAASAVFLALPVPLVLAADWQKAGHFVGANLLFFVSASVFATLALPLWAARNQTA